MGLVRAWRMSRTSAAGSRSRRRQRSRRSTTSRLAGSASDLASSDLAAALVLGPTPADEALRTLDSVVPANPQPWSRCSAGRSCWRCSVASMRPGRSRIPAARRRELTGEAMGDSTFGDISFARRRPRGAVGHLRVTANASRAARAEHPLDLGAEARPRALRARPLRRGGAARAARPRARRRARSRHADAVAAGAGARPRPRGEHAEAERLAREAVAIAERTDALNSRATRSATSPRCSPPPAAPEKPPQRSSRHSNATSARRTWPCSPK